MYNNGEQIKRVALYLHSNPATIIIDGSKGQVLRVAQVQLKDLNKE